MSTFFSSSHFGKKILRKYFYRNASMFSTIANSSLILSLDVCCMMRRATSFRLSEGWQKATTTTMLLRGCHLICSHQSPSAGKSQRLALVSRTSSILTFLLLFSLGIGQTQGGKGDLIWQLSCIYETITTKSLKNFYLFI